MITEFQNILHSKFPFCKEKKILLAVSGGVDSMVLLFLFSKLNYDFSVAHCNFNLRGTESDLDQDLVVGFCNDHKIELFVNSFETEEYANLNKQSIQIAARELRYQWFDELMSANTFDYLITAHHLDDSVETFLINFTRGTGIKGLLGIPEINSKTLRPLLHFSREQILNFAIENQIKWREDASNASTKYLRNKIRHEVIPILKSQNTDFLNTFQQTINHLNDAKSLMDDACEMVKQQVSVSSEHLLEIDILKLKQFKNYKAYLFQWLQDFGFTAWNDIYDLLDAETGKKVFSKNYILLKNRKSLILNEILTESESFFLINQNNNNSNSPISIIFETFKSEDSQSHDKSEIVLNADLLQFPLKLRKWQTADVFYPFGMKGKKKISKFFKDEKFSMFEKQNAWILENGNQEIIWIVGYRMDERFKITNQTINKIKIKFIK